MKSANPKNTWLAIGENCLTIDVLRRFSLNAPSTIYSSARSNMEHVMHCENTDYTDILDPRNLKTGRTSGGLDVVLSSSHKSRDLFRHGSNRYFEFTHHDPLTNENDMHLLRKRADRQIQLRRAPGNKIFVYHHRSIRGFSQDARDILYRGSNLLHEKYASAYAIFITQRIINGQDQKRGMEIDIAGDRQIFITLLTTKGWQGSDPDLFLARLDNDLLKAAFASCVRQFGLEEAIGVNADTKGRSG